MKKIFLLMMFLGMVAAWHTDNAVDVGCAAQVDVSGVEGQWHMRPLRLHDWTGDGDVVDAAIMVPLLSLRVEVDAGPPSNHVNDSTIRLIGEVFLLWCWWVILVVWVQVMRRWRRGGRTCTS